MSSVLFFSYCKYLFYKSLFVFIPNIMERDAMETVKIEHKWKVQRKLRARDIERDRETRWVER